MKFRNFFLVAPLILAFTAAAATETNSVRPMTLEEAIQIALQHNLDVQIEQFNPEINRFNLSGDYAAYDPVFSTRLQRSYRSTPGGFNNTTGLPIPPNETYNDSLSPDLSGALPSGLTYDISGDLLNHTTGTVSPNYRPSVNINLAQPLLRNLWIDGTRQQIRVNKKTLKISELGVRLQIENVINNVEQAYYDLIFSIENVRVQQMALELAERLLAENKRRVQVGAMAPLDEKQAESQVAGSRADLLAAQGNLDSQQNILKSLLTDDYRKWHSVFIQPTEKLVAIPEKFNVIESWQRGMSERADLLQSRVDIERRDIVLEYQKNQLFPQLDLIGSYGRNGLDSHWGGALRDIRDETNPQYSYGVLFSIPLSNRGPRTRYQAGKAQKEQALLQLKKLEETVLVQIDNAIKFAQTSFQRVDATRQARIYAEAALEAEQKKLENGKSTSFVVLQLQSNLTAARSAEIGALDAYNKALAQLAFNEGTILERNRLTLNVK